jgi:hypothetical protein
VGVFPCKRSNEHGRNDLMANTKAQFYYKSYIDGDVDGYSLNGDFGSTENMLDRNVNTYSITNGKDDDTLTATEEFDMKFDRTVGAFALRSNLKEFYLQYWDGSAWVSFSPAISYTTNDKSFLLMVLSTNITTSKIKLVATKTITADEEKKIYQFEITAKIAELYLESLEIEESWKKKKFETIYGGSVLITRYPNYGKTKMLLKFKNLAGTDYTAYKLLKNKMLVDSYNVYLYLSDDYDLFGEGAYYLVNDKAVFESIPAIPSLTAGIEGKLDLEEC